MSAGTPGVLMRGGMARGLILDPAHLPADIEQRDQFLLTAMGSPDVYGTQLDGLGAGSTSSSKCALVRASARPGIDIDYLFAQVQLDQPRVEWRRSCGNLAAAVALYAVQENLVAPSAHEWTPVSMWQENRGERIDARVNVKSGDVQLIFRASATRPTLPAGEPATRISVPGRPDLMVSVVDAGNESVFVSARHLDADISSAADFRRLKASVEQIQEAVRCALHRDPGSRPLRVFLIDPAHSLLTDRGVRIESSDVDLFVRTLSGNGFHESLPLTAAVATAVASLVPGTVVHTHVADGDAGDPDRRSRTLRVGHLSGVTTVDVAVTNASGSIVLESAAVSLTARRIMSGVVHS